MISTEYDEYELYLKSVPDDELEYEIDDTFVQINDEDESIKYALCIEEQNRRIRRKIYAR